MALRILFIDDATGETVFTAEAGDEFDLDTLAKDATLTARLPAALGAGGGLKVDGSGTALPVDSELTTADLDTGGGTDTRAVVGLVRAESGGAVLVGSANPLPVTGTVTITDGSGPVGVDGTVAATQSGSWSVEVANDSGNPLPVSGTVTATPPTYTAPVCGELAGATSATQMPNVACKMVQFRARSDNAGSVYIGVSGVTAPNGTTDTTTGLELVAGQSSGWIPVDNMNRLYRICANAGDDLTYLVMN